MVALSDQIYPTLQTFQNFLFLLITMKPTSEKESRSPLLYPPKWAISMIFYSWKVFLTSIEALIFSFWETLEMISWKVCKSNCYYKYR